MQNYTKPLSFLLSILFILGLASAQLPDSISKGFESAKSAANNAVNNAMNSAMGSITSCSGKLTGTYSSECNDKLKGFKLASAEKEAFTEATCCSVRDYIACLKEKVEADSECKALGGEVMKSVDGKFKENCSQFTACNSGTATLMATTVLPFFLLGLLAYMISA